jgi:hypothetical protein
VVVISLPRTATFIAEEFNEDIAAFAGCRVMGARQYGCDHKRDFPGSERNADALIGAGVNCGAVFTHFAVGKQQDACPGQSRTLPYGRDQLHLRWAIPLR